MQNCTVMAFRWRLIHLGYTEVSIKRAKWYSHQELYKVTARDPLFGVKTSRYMTITDMVVWR